MTMEQFPRTTVGGISMPRMIIGCNCYGFCSRTDIFFRIGGRLLRQIVRYFRGFCLFFAFAGN